MFSAFCTAVAAEVLLDTSVIEDLVSVGGRLAIEYRCSCGERGQWQDGRGAPYSLEALAS